MTRARRAAVVSLAVAAVGLTPGVARAEGSRPGWAFGQPGAEVGVASFVTSANLVYFLPQSAGGWGPSVEGPFDETADDWSDLFGSVGGVLVATGSGYALESGYLASVDAERPGVQALYATMVETESLLLSTAITQLLKRVVGRCRPRAFQATGCEERDAFPSGHTSSIASYAGARIYRLATTDPDPGMALRATSLALAEASTVTVGILRVLAGAHSWEDVLVGAAIGHGAGALVAATHAPVPVDTHAATREQRFYFEWGFPF